MENINQVRDELAEICSSLRNDEIVSTKAKELINGYGKMILATKVELEYHALNKDAREIPFLEYTEKGERKYGSGSA